MRLIDADALMDIYANRLELLGERYGSNSSECGVLSGAMKLLEAQPTIEERKTGEWITNLYAFGEDRYECDQCHNTALHYYDFCPNCGADMRGEQP